MVETFCTGKNCTQKQQCERYLQKDKAKLVSWWIDETLCIESKSVDNTTTKQPYSALLPKESK